MKKISWFTPQDTDISGLHWYSPGYKNAAVSLINALQEKQIGVFWNRSDIPIHVNFCQPYYYQLTNDYVIGYTPWESTKIPTGWISNMLSCDEIWTTSSFVKDIYQSNGIDKDVFVLHHGISDEWAIYDREIVNTFNFLHVGGDSKRKNSQMVVDAFIELFDGKEEFKLILKYSNHSNATVKINNRIVPAETHPQILGISDNFDIDNLVKLFHKCHCLVYPTMGEGFGMIPFEAIATGMPTICTNLTGCSDFAYMSIPLSATWQDASINSIDYQSDTGLWALPDYEELLSSMTNVVNYFDDIKKTTIQSAKIIHEKWSWSAVADKMISRLQKINYF
jgi:glycosyltransferase involved in cell wall biosynthesis